MGKHQVPSHNPKKKKKKITVYKKKKTRQTDSAESTFHRVSLPLPKKFVHVTFPSLVELGGRHEGGRGDNKQVAMSQPVKVANLN